MLPNFVVIGAMKAGTSSLWQYLKGHPQVFMAAQKEPQYFCAHRNWNRGQEWYESLFREAGSAIAVGEASTVYTKYPVHAGVPERMARVIPEAQLIYLVRDPIERIRSHYEHVLGLGSENRPVEVAVLEDSKYVNCSRYAFQVVRYLEWFSRDQLLIVTSEDLLNDRRATMGRVFGFLGIDPSWVPPGIDREHHVTRKREPRMFAQRLRRVPGYRRLARAVPSGMKSVYRRIATKSVVDRLGGAGKQGVRLQPIRIPNDVRRELEHRLADDVARLRGFLGPEFDGWGIA